MYQIIASDLDGTLLDSNHMVDAYTADTLQQLADRGLHFVIATGRHFKDVSGIRSMLGIRAHLITSNGARVHAPDDQLIYSKNVDAALVRELAQPKYAMGTLLSFYLDHDWLIDQPSPRLLEMHQDSGFHYQIRNLSKHNGEGVAKVLYVGEHSHLLQIEQRLQAAFGDTVTITFSAQDCLEVMAPGVSKGSALSMVLERLGLDAQNCLAFGDGQNDLELLQTAGHPRLMGNANPRLVAMLPHVKRIGSNQDSSVARHLRLLFNVSD